jgi:hypothetical protein
MGYTELLLIGGFHPPPSVSITIHLRPIQSANSLVKIVVVVEPGALGHPLGESRCRLVVLTQSHAAQMERHSRPGLSAIHSAPFLLSTLGFCPSLIGTLGSIAAGGVGTGAWRSRILNPRGAKTFLTVDWQFRHAACGGPVLFILKHRPSVGVGLLPFLGQNICSAQFPHQ